MCVFIKTFSESRENEHKHKSSTGFHLELLNPSVLLIHNSSVLRGTKDGDYFNISSSTTMLSNY